MNRFATLPLAALLMLVPALPAAARHSDRPERVRTPVVQRCGPELLHAAVRLDALTTKLYRHARADTRHPRRAERKALRKLKQLRRDARAFRRAAEDGRRVRRLNREFYELQHSYADASRRFRSLRPDRPLRRDFRRVARAVSRLDQELEELVVAQRRYRRHARFEVARHRSRHRH